MKEVACSQLNDEEIGRIYTKRKDMLHQEPERYIQALPFVQECVSNLYEHGLRLAIASASYEKEIKLVLSTIGILKYFEVLIGSDKIKNNKPEPDTYLAALKELKLPNKACVAVEDSPRGLRSAQMAGLFCFGVIYTHSAADLATADQIINDLSELKKYIKNK